MRIALSLTISLWLLSASGSWPLIQRAIEAPRELQRILETYAR